MCFFMSKCCAKSSKNVARVLIPRMKFDQLLNMHFRENDELLVRDPTNQLDMGDWILVRKLAVKKNINIEHEMVKLVYKHGNYICPLTNKQSYGYMFKDDYNKYNFKNVDEHNYLNDNK